MSSVSGVAGQIWSAPIVWNGGSNDDESENALLAANGVTDLGLLAEGEKTNFSRAFLDGLSPSQLSEKTVGSFDEGGSRITTYGDLKAYVETKDDMESRIETLMQTGTNSAAGDFSHANASDVEAAQVDLLAQDLLDNKPGALTAAQSYLSAVQAGQDPLAGASPRTVQSSWNTMLAYMKSNPHGNWSASDDANVALAALTASNADLTKEKSKLDVTA